MTWLLIIALAATTAGAVDATHGIVVGRRTGRAQVLLLAAAVIVSAVAAYMIVGMY